MSKSKGQGSITIKRFKNGGVYLKPSHKDMLTKYDFGGFLSGVLGGAAAGSTLGPLGMVGGALLKGISSINNQSNQNTQQIPQSIQRLIPQQQYYTPTFPEGGEVKKTTIKPVVVNPIDTAAIPVVYPASPDLLNSTRDKLKSYKNINDPELYKDLQPEQMASMFTALKESTNGRANAYTQRLLDNYNKLNPRTGVYYESDTIKSPTHLRSVFDDSPRYKELQKKYESEGQIKSNPTGRALGSGMIGVGTQQYPLGGVAQPNAELEQGEPFRTPNGDISQVSNEAPTHQEGGVPLNLPQGTQILGKMVDPMYGVEFKKLGEQLKKAQDKYQKILDTKPTPLARKTAKMMLDKVQGKYDELMQRQESMKPQQFPYGGMPLMENGRVSMKYPYGGQLPKYWGPNDTNGNSMVVNDNFGQGIPLQGTSEQSYSSVNSNYPIVSKDMMYNPKLTLLQRMPIGQVSNRLAQPQRLAISNPSQEIADNNSNIGDIASTLGSLSPVAYNVAKGVFGKAKQLNPADYMNPYSGQIKSLVANRRYNVDPELESNRLATAQYYQNLKNAAPSQSRYLAGLQSGQISNQRANQEVYARANNMNNQYRGEQANVLQGLGQQEANTKLNIQDINSRAQAAKDNYLPTALSQLSQFSQIQKQMSGQKKLDKQRLAVAKEMFKNYPFDVTKIIGQ